MWELLTGDEPYADMHCASIIGKHKIVEDCILFPICVSMCDFDLCICFLILICRRNCE